MRKKILIMVAMLSVFTAFTSCDCMQHISGTVIDAQTEQPIQGVHLHKENKPYDQSDTDEKGNYEIRSISGGLFGCPSMIVIVNKEGYETQKVKIKIREPKTIKLKRIE